MSRLYDRVLAGCAPFRFSDLECRRELERLVGSATRRELPDKVTLGGRLADDVELGRLLFDGKEPTATRSFVRGSLDGVPVVAADEVSAYCETLPMGTSVEDLVGTVAPPYPRVFVECQTGTGTFRNIRLHAFGFLFSGVDLTDPANRSQLPDLRLGTVVAALQREPFEVPDELADREVRWVLAAHPVIEPRKGRPCGPVGEYLFPLGSDGCLIRNAAGDTVSVEGLVDMDLPLGPTLEQHLLTRIDSLLLPALFALSLMHCRNVTVRTVDPPAALAKKAARHHGRPLTRYHVLDIAPMREVLDGKGEAKRRGLRHALHLCRGHFKTFTPDAPLFGRHVGQYWWADHARGNKQNGNIDKDYRLRLTSS